MVEMEPRPKTTGCESSIKHVFSGTLVHSTVENMMDICQNKIVGVDDDGKVTESAHIAKRFDFHWNPLVAFVLRNFFGFIYLSFAIDIS